MVDQMEANVGSYFSPAHDNSLNRDDLVLQYFNQGFSYDEIIKFLLSCHQISLSKRQLHRILRKSDLYRRKEKSPLNNLIKEVFELIKHSGSNFGYRMVHQKLRQKGFVCDRETVRLILLSLDPNGVDLRSKHKLKRRTYRSAGPNHLWHIDGYDKLKPYGFSVHGAIDGFSRKVLWLEVTESNKDPKIVASHYVECIKTLKLVPKMIRADRGSENVVICGMQRFLRRSFTDQCAGNQSFVYGSSTTNQRIESWWSSFRRSRANWWINFFKDLVHNGELDTSLDEHIQCLRFCFLGILQSDFDEAKSMWNTHRMRKTRDAECPGGRPDALYFTPDIAGGRDCSFPVTQEDLSILPQFIKQSQPFGCTDDYIDHLRTVMEENNLYISSDIEQAKELFLKLTSML